MPRNPAKDSRPSFGRAHVRVWEQDYTYIVSFPDPHVRPPENLSQDFLALLSQHVRKTGKPIRTQDSKQSSDFNAYCTGTPLNSNCQVYILALESARTKHMTIVLNYVKYVIVLIQHCQEILRNDPSFGRAHVRVWERDYLVPRPFFAGEGKTQWPGHHCSRMRGIFRKISV